jgi:hypothetical protein
MSITIEDIRTRLEQAQGEIVRQNERRGIYLDRRFEPAYWEADAEYWKWSGILDRVEAGEDPIIAVLDR